ncbi:DUF5133 domain-containing protein [Streptomyces griseomycini]|uniref:DUF5133 domain-containing protein n=1 Tax=Streptomyces griseomycini TaxID=66895 RepID=A0A7W7PSH4_9ACTN|nr:DUF5133 domain-containing protein [Streptomyces griseomycini]MBB4899525.1 hypothetical protein [Streptomyces griseomycini]GGR08418.1 hypothetical protein GCM10015536_12180 [Streptomyces griseomycini]
MLKPHPTVLRRLVEEYEALRPARAVPGPDAADPRLSDLAYTLCVSTGTRDVEDALRTAHRWLAAAPTTVPAPHPGPDALVPSAGRRRRDTAEPAGAPAPV